MAKIKKVLLGTLCAILVFSCTLVNTQVAHAWVGAAISFALQVLNDAASSAAQRTAAKGVLFNSWSSSNGLASNLIEVSGDTLSDICSNLNTNGVACVIEYSSNMANTGISGYWIKCIQEPRYMTGTDSRIDADHIYVGKHYGNMANLVCYVYSKYHDSTNLLTTILGKFEGSTGVITYLDSISRGVSAIAGYVDQLEGYVDGLEGALSNVLTYFTNQATVLGNIKSGTDYLDDIYGSVRNGIWCTNNTTYTNGNAYTSYTISYSMAEQIVSDLNANFMGQQLRWLDRDAHNTELSSNIRWFMGAYIRAEDRQIMVRHVNSSGTTGSSYYVSPDHRFFFATNDQLVNIVSYIDGVESGLSNLLSAVDGVEGSLSTLTTPNIWVNNVPATFASWPEWHVPYSIGMSIIEAVNNGHGYARFLSTTGGNFVESRIAIVGTPYINSSGQIQIKGLKADGTDSTYTVVMPDHKVIIVDPDPVLSIIDSVDGIEGALSNIQSSVNNIGTSLNTVNTNLGTIISNMGNGGTYDDTNVINAIEAVEDALYGTVQTRSGALVPVGQSIMSVVDSSSSLVTSFGNLLMPLGPLDLMLTGVGEIIDIIDDFTADPDYTRVLNNIYGTLHTTVDNVDYTEAELTAMIAQRVNDIYETMDGADILDIPTLVTVINTWGDDVVNTVLSSSHILSLYYKAFGDLNTPISPYVWSEAENYFDGFYGGET